LSTLILATLFISGLTGKGHSQMMPPDIPSSPSSGENPMVSPGSEIANDSADPQMMAPGGQMPNEMAGVPSQMMPPGIQIPKMVEGKYVNSEYGIEMVLAEGLKGMETSAAGSTNVMIFFGGGPGGMGAGPGMTSNPSGTGGMPEMSTFMVSLTDPSKMEQSNETASTSFDPNVTLPTDVPINKNQLPKIDCKPGSSETVNIGGKSAQVSTSDCTITSSEPKGTMYMKSKDYTIDLGEGKSVNIRYSAMSSSSSASVSSTYDSNLGKFDETIQTIKFTK
jgi:hypothetical protein